MTSINIFLEQLFGRKFFTPTKHIMKTPTNRMLNQKISPNSVGVNAIHKGRVNSDINKDRQSVNTNASFSRRITKKDEELVNKKQNIPIV